MKPSRNAPGERVASIADPEPEPLFAPVAVKPRHDDWTVDRQRTFLTVLAETGSIREACIHAGVSSRSAYRLRARPDAQSFAAAWDQALKLATSRLTALAPSTACQGRRSGQAPNARPSGACARHGETANSSARP